MSMAVMERDAWTDERMDDLAAGIDKRFDQVDQRFDRVEGDIRELRAEMKKGFERIDARFEHIDGKFDGRFESLNSKLDSLQRTMIIGFVTLFASIAASLIGGIFAAITLA